MGSSSRFSSQTLAVLAELCVTPSQWRHGYGIARDTGLKSGTLYPVLIRLADSGLVEACWEEEQPAGRLRRHLYRLRLKGSRPLRAALGRPGRRSQSSPPPAASRSPSSAKTRPCSRHWLNTAFQIPNA